MSDPTRPDPEAIYVALSSGVFKIDGTIHRYIRGESYRGDDPPVVKFPARFRLAPEDATRRLLARLVAEREPPAEASASDPAPPDGVDEDDEPRLPGDLTWPQIESEYRRLADAPTGWRSRRRRRDEPSRPETARALGVSPATLKRACMAAGRGTRWPPAGL